MPSEVEVTETQNVECRASMRVPVRIPVTIVFPPLVGHQSIRAVTRNVSFDGVLINSRNPSLEKGTHVRVLLEIAGKEPIIVYALVVRSTYEGLALMFTVYEKDVIESLSAVLTTEFDKHVEGRFIPDGEANAMPPVQTVNSRK